MWRLGAKTQVVTNLAAGTVRSAFRAVTIHVILAAVAL